MPGDYSGYYTAAVAIIILMVLLYYTLYIDNRPDNNVETRHFTSRQRTGDRRLASELRTQERTRVHVEVDTMEVIGTALHMRMSTRSISPIPMHAIPGAHLPGKMPRHRYPPQPPDPAQTKKISVPSVR